MKYQTVEDERLKQALVSQINFDGSSDDDDDDQKRSQKVTKQQLGPQNFGIQDTEGKSEGEEVLPAFQSYAAAVVNQTAPVKKDERDPFIEHNE